MSEKKKLVIMAMRVEDSEAELSKRVEVGDEQVE